MELIASLAYLVLGGEHLWFPRLLSAAFWMIGGVFLYLIAKKIASPNAALFSVFFYLFVPFGVLPSRAFMPDPLMIMTLLIGIFAILRYHEKPSTRRLAIAATASALAVFVKPGICFFQVFGVFVSLTVYREGLRRSLINPHLLTFAALSVLPTGLYYFYGTFVEGFLQRQAGEKIGPQLVLEPSFWVGWLEQIQSVVGFVALVGALLGLVLLRPGLPRALMVGLWGGYFLFGLVFTFHIHTHPYYSLQFIPVVALALGPAGALAMDYLGRVMNYPRQVDLRYYGRVIAIALFFLAAILSVVEHREIIFGIAEQAQDEDSPGRCVERHDFTADCEGRVKTYEEIGEVVNHSPLTLSLAPEWGYPLMYHGRLYGMAWSSLPEDRDWEKHLRGPTKTDAVYSEYPPEYFIVITRFDNYDSRVNWWKSEEYEDLRSFLTENFPVAAEEDDYVVFDLREKD